MGPDLYYALGGGLGHLTRARAAIATLGLQARVLALSPYTRDAALVQGLDLLELPEVLATDPQGLGPWLEGLLWEWRPRRLFLDSFPCGILGELCGVRLPPDLEIHYLARLLRWDRYAARLAGRPPALHRVYCLEPLSPDHWSWLGARASEPLELALKEPDLPPPTEAMSGLARLARPRWLVVHSGPAAEIRELLDYARDMALAEGQEPRLVLVAPDGLQYEDSGVTRLSAYPARFLYPLAERIVTACGFNVMAETRPYRSIHRFLPMPRALDDQHERAARARCREAAGLQG